MARWHVHYVSYGRLLYKLFRRLHAKGETSGEIILPILTRPQLLEKSFYLYQPDRSFWKNHFTYISPTATFGEIILPIAKRVYFMA